MLADQLDYVVGVDSHRGRHAFAVLAASGELVEEQELGADQAGYRQALALAERAAPGRRVWAIEGTGSYAAGLTRFLAGRGERVLEVERPKRAGSRSRLKTDRLDAIRAAPASSRSHEQRCCAAAPSCAPNQQASSTDSCSPSVPAHAAHSNSNKKQPNSHTRSPTRSTNSHPACSTSPESDRSLPPNS
jgi:hypothetical protein